MNLSILSDQIDALVQRVAQMLRDRGLRLAVAESCTGGWVAAALTALPGSSDWFDRGYVTYSNAAKQQMLGVSQITLEAYGAVSEQTVAEMVDGVIQQGNCDLALAISGIAGPTGGSAEKPVGTVCFAWRFRQEPVITTRLHFDGDRQQVRVQAVIHALEQLIWQLEYVW